MKRYISSAVAALSALAMLVSLDAVAAAEPAEVDPVSPWGPTSIGKHSQYAAAAEQGFNENNIDNAAGVAWEPTRNPQSKLTPGQMRSDREKIPGGFTKEEADRAEIQEAEEQQLGKFAQISGLRRAPSNCRTYWPSPYKVCGKIREKYDAMGGPKSFLTWPKSDELGVPDGVGRRNEFVNGFIYWHPKAGAHSVTTHFSIVWARTGWERGPLGYPTGDEIGLSDKIGRKQSFQHGEIYGSLAGLASIHGAILKKWKSLGAERSILGYPTTDELSTPDGKGRFNRFRGGVIYWHPEHGAHYVRGGVLDEWAASGYESGKYGYPVSDPHSEHFRVSQRFSGGVVNNFESPLPELAKIVGLNKKELEQTYIDLKEAYESRGIDLADGFTDSYEQAKESFEFANGEGSDPSLRTRIYQGQTLRALPGLACSESDLVKPGNERTNRGDLFYSSAVRAKVVDHGHNGMFLTPGNSDVNQIETIEALNPEKGVRKVKGASRLGVCRPRYLSVNTDDAIRVKAADWAESKEGKAYNRNFVTTRIGLLDRDSYNCSQLVWAAYKHASGGGLDIGEEFPYQPYRAGVYPKDILFSHNTREFK